MSRKIMLPCERGAKLKSLLKERCITQEAFADLAYVEVRTVRRWLKGEGLDSVTNLSACADILEVDVMTILYE